jgi:hypothetical protein
MPLRKDSTKSQLCKAFHRLSNCTSFYLKVLTWLSPCWHHCKTTTSGCFVQDMCNTDKQLDSTWSMRYLVKNVRRTVGVLNPLPWKILNSFRGLFPATPACDVHDWTNPCCYIREQRPDALHQNMINSCQRRSKIVSRLLFFRIMICFIVFEATRRSKKECAYHDNSHSSKCSYRAVSEKYPNAHLLRFMSTSLRDTVVDQTSHDSPPAVHDAKKKFKIFTQEK